MLIVVLGVLVMHGLAQILSSSKWTSVSIAVVATCQLASSQDTAPTVSDLMGMQVTEDIDTYWSNAWDSSKTVEFGSFVDPVPELQRDYLKDFVSSANGLELQATSIDGKLSGQAALDAISGASNVPVARFSLLLDPNASRSEFEQTISDNDFLIVDVSETFGLVSVARAIGEEGDPADGPEFQHILDKYLQELNESAHILSAIPEPNLSQFNFEGLEFSVGPMPYGGDLELDFEHTSLSDVTLDWGMENIGAIAAWDLPASQRGVAVGVIDSGFSDHEDLPFWDLPFEMRRSNHGNHVSGILCGKHNQFGISGVLPTCLIVARRPEFKRLVGGFGVEPSSMTAVANAIEEIIEERPELKVINISLGYNWRERHGYTTLPEKHRKEVVNTVQQLGRVYQLANDNGVFLVSAAGNDSWDLEEKLGAHWASPMNFASFAFCKDHNLCNGLVVEAHDADDSHADFSNVNGHLSCPGVKVLSAVAVDENLQNSRAAYAVTSGTSMSSPYCAGGVALLALNRPNYSVSEILSCAIRSGRSTGEFSAPALDLQAALDLCPKR